ncbi:hypothetical protein Tco_1358227 [Tanacetum coccineum]
MDDWSKFASSVIPVFDAENRPVPAVIHFSSTYEQGESSSAREILKDIAEVDERIMKKIDKNDLRIRMVGRDAMNLDGVVRECQDDVSKVISMMESMSLEGGFVETSTRLFLGPFPNDPYVEARNDAMADDDVKEDDDMDDDVADPSDAQSSEPCGSPRNS